MHAFVSNVVCHHFLTDTTQRVIIHKSQNELENSQRFKVITLFLFGQKWSFNGLPFHLPQMGFEIDVCHFGKGKVVNVMGQFFGNRHHRNLPTHFAKMLVRGIDHFPIFHFAQDKSQFSWHFPKIERKYIYYCSN